MGHDYPRCSKERPYQERITQENLKIGFDYALTMHGVRFKAGKDIDENDPCKVVLKPAGYYEEEEVGEFMNKAKKGLWGK